MPFHISSCISQYSIYYYWVRGLFRGGNQVNCCQCPARMDIGRVFGLFLRPMSHVLGQWAHPDPVRRATADEEAEEKRE